MRTRKITSLALVACLLWETTSMAGPAGAVSLGKTLERAQSDYSRLEFDAARKSLQRKIDQLSREGMTHEDTLSLIPASILLGELFYISGDTERAKRTFEEVTRLAPETVLSEKKYAPQIRKLFDEAKESIVSRNKDLGALKVTSSSGKAKVYLNGTLKGETPLQIKKVMPGQQFVSFTREGKEDLIQKVDLKAGETVKVAGDFSSAADKTTEVASKAETKPAKEEKVPAGDSRSFWKKPVVWIVAGVLVAGGGASAGLLLTRSGESSPAPAGDITISLNGGKPAGLQ